jgi:hypothetical protein
MTTSRMLRLTPSVGIHKLDHERALLDVDDSRVARNVLQVEGIDGII